MNGVPLDFSSSSSSSSSSSEKSSTKSSFTGAAGANVLDLNAANLDALGIGPNLQNMAAYSSSAQGGSAGGLDSSTKNGADNALKRTTTTLTTTRNTVNGSTGNAADAMANYQALVANAFNAQNAPVFGQSAARSFSFRTSGGSTSSGMNSGNQMAQAPNVVPMASGSSVLSRSQSYTPIVRNPVDLVNGGLGGVIRTTTTTVRNVTGGVGGNGALLATAGMGAMGSSGRYTSQSSFSSGSSSDRQIRSY